MFLAEARSVRVSGPARISAEGVSDTQGRIGTGINHLYHSVFTVFKQTVIFFGVMSSNT